MKILNQKQEKILDEIRLIIGKLKQTLVSFGAAIEDKDHLEQSAQQIDDLFLLVVVGEFNSGKSAFINALLGEKVLEEGVTPTTTKVNLLRYGSSQARNALEKDLHLIQAPINLLSDISIVDTPGTNAIIREHESITINYVPRSDFVFFVTSADRPLTDSEKNFMKTIKDWGKKVVIILNKIDILENETDIQHIVDFISSNVSNLLNISPEVFPISAKYALSGKRGNNEHWKKSKFEDLEHFISEHLDDKTKIMFKFQNPLGVVNNITNKYDQIFCERLDLLQEDIALIKNIENQLESYEKDMNRDFRFRLADIEKILVEMKQRGQEFFDETLRFLNIFGLLHKEEIQRSFEKSVMADVPLQIEQKILELIDWMVEQEYRQWETSLKLISARQVKYEEKVFQDPGSAAFNYDRRRLIDDLNITAKDIVNTYDRKKEAKKIADNAQEAVATTAALGAGAVGIGTLVATLTTTLAVDITGIVLAGTLAILGIIVIPSRRKKINKELSEKINALKDNLSSSLHNQFSSEIKNSLKNLSTAFTPYTKFINAENANINNMRKELKLIRSKTDQLLRSIEDFS